jgi:hypothetical protein
LQLKGARWDFLNCNFRSARSAVLLFWHLIFLGWKNSIIVLVSFWRLCMSGQVHSFG